MIKANDSVVVDAIRLRTPKTMNDKDLLDEPESSLSTWEPSSRDHVIEYGWMVLFSPLWVPLWIIGTVALHAKLFWVLRGTTQAAWERCSEHWSKSQTLYGAAVGALMTTPFEHSISEYFRWYHSNARDFLFVQLENKNPYLAGYAFKCLIRYGPIELSDIPTEVLQRKEEINALRFGCCVETMPIGQYIAEYFESSQYLRSLDAT